MDLDKAVGEGNAPERALISNASPYRDADSEVWNGLGTLEPPYPFEWLWAVYEKSAILRPPIAAMATNIHGHGYRLAPVISEKATFVAEKNEQVVFRVAGDATKPEVKAAVELLFKVEVEGVQVANVKGSI